MLKLVKISRNIEHKLIKMDSMFLINWNLVEKEVHKEGFSATWRPPKIEPLDFRAHIWY